MNYYTDTNISGTCISDEVFYSSISKRMDGEVHESDDCEAVARYGELNEHGKKVVVLIRICYCSKHETKKHILRPGNN